ncbi:MAG: hypothetical protein NT154_05435 [Verrucomicrobia bacterium]|nr:hypothetical protein [Verrucomicrobiota bacterium]
MIDPNGKYEPLNADELGDIFTVEPEVVEGCECEDCRAGRHVYSLYEWTGVGWEWAAISLRLYSSAEECKLKHWWGIDLGPNAVWEDGTPVVEPDPTLGKRPAEQDSGVEGQFFSIPKPLRNRSRRWRSTGTG